MFNKQAIENIKATGNVWGHSTEYDFKFKFKIWNREFHFEQRAQESFMGRFGGGWNVKLGIQAGSFKSLFLLKDVIINLFTMSIRIRKALKEAA